MKLLLLIMLLCSIHAIQAQTTYDIAIGRVNPDGSTLLEQGDISWPMPQDVYYTKNTASYYRGINYNGQ